MNGVGQTFAQKTIAAHADQDAVEVGELVGARVDLVVSDELSFPQVIGEFEALGASAVFDPDRIAIVADHETPARNLVAAQTMQAVRRFAKEHAIHHLLDAGDAGIIHVVIPELGLIAPGELMMGYDSHVLTAGALGAFAVGVGATDAAVAMAFGEMWLRVPDSVQIKISGTPQMWTTPKDAGLLIVQRLGQEGCLYQAIEYEGDYPRRLGMDGRLTLTNIAIEVGAKSAAIQPDETTFRYLKPRLHRDFNPVWADSEASYTATHVFDVGDLPPLVSAPGAPDQATPVVDVSGQPVDQVFIGTCTNGRLTDLRVAAAVIRGRRVHPRSRLIIVPGSPEVLRAALDEGLISAFVSAGAVVAPPGCGPCAGLHLGVLGDGEVGIATSSRNFPGRMGAPTSELYLAGPAVAAASAVAGQLVHPAEVVGTEPPQELAQALSGFL